MHRIRKVTGGKFVVEVLVSRWSLFGLRKKWIPYVKSAGLDCAWKHSSYDMALMNYKKEMLDEIYEQDDILWI